MCDRLRCKRLSTENLIMKVLCSFRVVPSLEQIHDSSLYSDIAVKAFHHLKSGTLEDSWDLVSQPVVLVTFQTRGKGVGEWEGNRRGNSEVGSGLRGDWRVCAKAGSTQLQYSILFELHKPMMGLVERQKFGEPVRYRDSMQLSYVHVCKFQM